MNDRVKILAFSITAAAVFSATACTTPGSGPVNTNATAIGANRNGSASNTNAAASSSDATPLSDADKAFMMKAATASQAEVELGYLAAEKATNSGVRTFGKRMVDEHMRANDELKQLASQKGVTLPAELDATHKETKDRLSKLSGAAFDSAYIAQMVKDHNAAISDFENEAGQGQNGNVRAWAAKTLATLRNHLQMAIETETALRGGKPANAGAGNNNARR